MDWVSDCRAVTSLCVRLIYVTHKVTTLLVRFGMGHQREHGPSTSYRRGMIQTVEGNTDEIGSITASASNLGEADRLHKSKQTIRRHQNDCM